MTRDEVRELIAKAVDDSTQVINMGDYQVFETDSAAASDAVLAEFAARGIVLGTEEPELTVDERCRLGSFINPTGHFDITIDDLYKVTEKMGLALVRVVPND